MHLLRGQAARHLANAAAQLNEAIASVLMDDSTGDDAARQDINRALENIGYAYKAILQTRPDKE